MGNFSSPVFGLFKVKILTFSGLQWFMMLIPRIGSLILSSLRIDLFLFFSVPEIVFLNLLATVICFLMDPISLFLL